LWVFARPDLRRSNRFFTPLEASSLTDNPRHKQTLH